MLGLFEYFKIIIIGSLVVVGFYFLFEVPANPWEIPEVRADISTTSLNVGNASPTVSSVSLNGGNHINLIEGSATTVSATATVSDNNTHGDISTVVGRLYRSGVTSTAGCVTDGSNCYGTTTCATSSCGTNDCIATCQFNIWFIAEPTDAGSDWSTEHWVVWIQATDRQSTSSNATNTAQTINMNTLTALDVTDNISYGALSPGQTMSPLSQTTTATTTGNKAIDADISGQHMCTDYPTCNNNTTSIEYQHYATSSGMNYASTSHGAYIASTTAQSLDFTSSKPTATPSDQGQQVYWGTSVPGGATFGNYEGENTYTAK